MVGTKIGKNQMTNTAAAEQDRERDRTFAAAVDGAAPKTDRVAF